MRTSDRGHRSGVIPTGKRVPDESSGPAWGGRKRRRAVSGAGGVRCFRERQVLFLILLLHSSKTSVIISDSSEKEALCRVGISVLQRLPKPLRRVRLPYPAPAQKFPPLFRFRLRRKLHCGGNFFAFASDSLRWTRGRAGWERRRQPVWKIDFDRLFQLRNSHHRSVSGFAENCLWWEFLCFCPRLASLDSEASRAGETETVGPESRF